MSSPQSLWCMCGNVTQIVKGTKTSYEIWSPDGLARAKKNIMLIATFNFIWLTPKSLTLK